MSSHQQPRKHGRDRNEGEIAEGELVRRLDHHIGRAGDEIVRLEQPVDRRLRDEVLILSVKGTASSRGDNSGSPAPGR